MKVLSDLKTKVSAKSVYQVMVFLISFLGTIGICKFCGIANNPELPLNTFLFLVFLVLLIVGYSKRSRDLKKGAKILSGVLTTILAVILVIGKQLELLGAINWSLGTILTIVCLGCAIYIAVEYTVIFCTTFVISGDLTLTRKNKLVIFGIIFLSNFLIFLAVFPGIYGWDSNMQAWQFLHNGVNTHYSVLLGAIFGSILEIGKLIFGSYAAGMAIAMFLQMIIMSYIYSCVVYFVVEETKNKVALVATVMFFTLTLIMGLATVYSTQDIIFGGIFALIFMDLYRLAKKPEHWGNKINVIRFIILSFLLCACRNNGIYVLMIALVAMLFIKTQRKRNVLIMAVPIVLSLFYTNVFFRVLQIPDVDSMREILSVPSQQLARVYVFSQGALSSDEKEKIEEFYDLEKFMQYNVFTMKADMTKAALNLDVLKSNMSDYVATWAKVGLKNPKAYIEAFLLNSLGTWYPNKEFNDPRANIPYIEYGMSNLWNEYDGEYVSMRVDRHSLLPLYDKILLELFRDNHWQSIPLFANIISMGTYFILFVFVCGIAIYKKRKDYIIPMSLILGNYLILLVAPVSVFRYCYPMIIVAPIMFVMLFSTRSKIRKAKELEG